MSEYAPGTVAVATVRGVEGVLIVRTARRDEFAWYDTTERHRWLKEDDLTDVRPLVVLDPLAWWPNETDRRRVISNLREWGALFIADAIEAQTRPPKPAEPQGLGAVVEDAEGSRWVRCDADETPWYRVDSDDWYSWRNLDAVRVLSEGVQP